MQTQQTQQTQQTRQTRQTRQTQQAQVGRDRAERAEETPADDGHQVVRQRQPALNEHLPALIPGFEPGTWRVMCLACSQAAGEYTYPCRVQAWHPTRVPPPVVQRAY